MAETNGDIPGVPEIRVRKGSDAPSLGEAKKSYPAPLASFEALSDVDDLDESDNEIHSEGTEDMFARTSPPAVSRVKLPTLQVPSSSSSSTAGKHQQQQQQQQSGSTHNVVGTDSGGGSSSSSSSGREAVTVISDTAASLGAEWATASVEEAVGLRSLSPDSYSAEDPFQHQRLNEEEEEEEEEEVTPHTSRRSSRDDTVTTPTTPTAPRPPPPTPQSLSSPSVEKNPQGNYRTDMASTNNVSRSESYHLEEEEEEEEGELAAIEDTTAVHGDQQEYYYSSAGDMGDNLAEGVGMADDTFISRKHDGDSLETHAVERPRSATPIELVGFDDYAAATEATPVPHTEEKIKIVLPGSGHHHHRPKSPRKPAPQKEVAAAAPATDSWMDFGQDSSVSDVQQEVSDGESGSQNVSGSKRPPGPPRPPPPSAGKPPSRPPPPSKQKGAPQRPGGSPAVTKKNWETFDGPARPPPPRPVKITIQEPDKHKKDSADTTDQSSFDDESALFDPSSPTEKKSKHKGLTAKKTRSTAKSPKKERKEKATKEAGEALNKFVAEDSTPKSKDTEEWQAFMAMQNRVSAVVTQSQAKLSAKDEGFEKELDKLSTSASHSPWGAIPPHGGSTAGEVTEETAAVDVKPNPKTSWIGFEDDFSVTTNMELGQKLSHLNVSPLPSPKRPPAPPYNSRRSSTEKSNGEVVDLLGFTSTDQPTTTGPRSEQTVDLLGLELDHEMGSESAAPAEAPGPIGVNEDILCQLSRNPVESEQSSGHSSPAAGENMADTSGKNEKLTGAALSIVDEFLGIEGQELKKPVDHLEALLNKEKKPPTPEQSVEVPEGVERGDFFVNADVKATVMDDDDDPFGLGTTKKTPAVTKPAPVVAAPVAVAEPDDLFTVDESVKRIAAGGSITAAKPPPPAAAAAGDDFDDFDPRADISADQIAVKPAVDQAPPTWGASPRGSPKVVASPRPRPRPSGTTKATNPFKLALATDMAAGEDLMDTSAPAAAATDTNPFTSTAGTVEPSAVNPFADAVADASAQDDENGMDFLGENVTAAEAVAGEFNPFATITDAEAAQHQQPQQPQQPQQQQQQQQQQHQEGDSFDPFQTIHGDDAFDVNFSAFGQDTTSAEQTEDDDGTLSPARFNPFDKEPPLDDKFASFEPKPKKEGAESFESPREGQTPSEMSTEEDDEETEPLELFVPEFTGEGWSLFLRQPTKKKLTQNRFWKPVFVRIIVNNNLPVLRIYNNDKESESIHELALQPSYNINNMGLQTYDQFGKCHTVKIQYVFYRERMGVKAERIAPTLSDLTRVRDFKGLKDLVHRPKTTMLLDHAPQTSELLKFGSLEFESFKSFLHVLEDSLFRMDARRDKTLQYTKDEITADIIDEYYAEIDQEGHIINHKARVRVFCLAFLTGMPVVEIGVNDKRRRGKEVVGRNDIIPIKTEEWIRISNQELHSSIDISEFEKTRVVKFKPLDACHFEVMRFRVQPRPNRELPLQVKVQMSLIERHFEIRADVLIPGYFSNSRRAAQTPCEDIQIRFPIPESWIYLFRVEKRFRYGTVKSSTRKPGKIKGFERLTMMAQGMLPPSLIEVTSGQAKYEHVFHSIVWRISRLPERNEGAYKTHMLVCKLDLGPHDVIPDDFEKVVFVEFNMPNSTVSRAQIRSISVNTPEDPPDKWVHHLAKYQYKVAMEFSDQAPVKAPLENPLTSPESPPVSKQPSLKSEPSNDADKENDSDTSTDSDSD